MIAKNWGPAYRVRPYGNLYHSKKREEEEDKEDLELVSNPVSIGHLTRDVNSEIIGTNHHMPCL